MDTSHRQEAVVNSYFEIMYAYNLLRQTLPVMMTMYIAITLIWPLIYTQYCLSLSALQILDFSNSNSWYQIIWIAIYTIKNMIIVCTMSAESELFYIRVNEAQVICVEIIASRDNKVGERRLCKNIIRSHRHQFRPLSASIFNVDGRLPLEVLALISTHFFVMLQFNLLGNIDSPDLAHSGQ
ncbi:hypothetical protein ACJJTC_015135 [Scirpophaga incertulas]